MRGRRAVRIAMMKGAAGKSKHDSAEQLGERDWAEQLGGCGQVKQLGGAT